MSLDKRNLNIDLLKVMSCIAVVGLHTLNFHFKKNGGGIHLNA